MRIEGLVENFGTVNRRKIEVVLGMLFLLIILAFYQFLLDSGVNGESGVFLLYLYKDLYTGVIGFPLLYSLTLYSFNQLLLKQPVMLIRIGGRKKILAVHREITAFFIGLFVMSSLFVALFLSLFTLKQSWLWTEEAVLLYEMLFQQKPSLELPLFVQLIVAIIFFLSYLTFLSQLFLAVSLAMKEGFSALITVSFIFFQSFLHKYQLQEFLFGIFPINHHGTSSVVVVVSNLGYWALLLIIFYFLNQRLIRRRNF